MKMTLPDQTIAETITLTPAAADAVRQIMARKNLNGYALRLFLSGGGCSGNQYGLALDNRNRPEDYVTETNGIKLVIDEVSIKYLQGATVDYTPGEAENGFRIINPNPISACNCGQDSNGCEDEVPGGCSGCC
jgi:iron-sulfur cluster assembly protein